VEPQKLFEQQAIELVDFTHVEDHSMSEILLQQRPDLLGQ
jgi:hypothetical protein